MRSLTGLGRLVRLILRRDRVRLPVWVLALAGIVLGSAASLVPLYPEQVDIQQYVDLFGDNPALVAFAGPGYGFDDPNLGVILVNETQLWACLGIALMCIFLVNRHTRAEEEAERTEVLRSSVVGRHAPTAAAVIVVGATSVLVAALCGLGFIALGYGATGSLTYAAGLAGCGLVFTGLTAAIAQVAGSSRATLGLATAVLGLAFVLRAVGDIADSGLRWLSPIGWAQGVRAFADERWWPVALCLATTLLAVVAAFWLATRRDLGSGILPQRPGPARGGRWSAGPLGLAVRLQRGSVLAWMVGLALMGGVYGSIGEDVEQMIEDNEAFADVLAQLEGADVTDSFFATAVAMQALLAAGFAISAALRVRSEEAAGRVEPVLAAPVGRWRWAWSHLLVAAVGTVLVVAAGGLGVGASYAVVSGDAGQVLRLTGAALATVPAVLVLAGVAVALFGASLRLAVVAWAGLGVIVLIELFGELLRLPSWSQAVSPLHHVPALPAEDLRALPLLALTALAVALTAVGLTRFRARDLQVG
jgi:ABC-2 type transport system permease protein